MEVTQELKAKALACETVEELLALAAENEIEATAEDAEIFLRDMHEAREGELADEELGDVSGGAAGCKRNAREIVYYKYSVDVEFIFNIGDTAQAFVGAKYGNETATVRITHNSTQESEHGWYDIYKYERISGAPTAWGFGWSPRSRFEK